MSVEQARACFARDRFAEFLGAAIVDVSEERAVAALPYREELMNVGGILSGGASASLINVAGTVAAWGAMDVGAELQAGCVDLSVRYLTASAREDIVAEAVVLRRGRDLCFLDVGLRNPAGSPVCHGLMAYRASDYAGHPPRLHAPHSPPPPPAAETPPDDPWLLRGGYMKRLEITPVHQSPGHVRLRMPCTALHTNERGQMHAGALASLLDIAGVSATWSLVPGRQGARGSTIGIHVSYASATADPVIADARVQHRSEEILFSTVHVMSVRTGQLVALGQVSYRLLEPR